MIEVRKENLSLFERRPEAWPLVLMLDRIEEPLRRLRLRALELQEQGDARCLLIMAGGAAGGDGEYRSKKQDASWLLGRTSELRSCVEALVSLINVDLEIALGPPGVEADPAAIDRVCSKLILRLEKCMELEREIVSRRLNPELEETQFAFAGLTAGFVAPHQDLVAKIREFVENGNGTNFTFTVRFDAALLARAFPECGIVQRPLPSVPKPSASSTGAGGCLVMLAAAILVFGVPFPVVLKGALIVGVLCLLGKR